MRVKFQFVSKILLRFNAMIEKYFFCQKMALLKYFLLTNCRQIDLQYKTLFILWISNKLLYYKDCKALECKSIVSSLVKELRNLNILLSLFKHLVIRRHEKNLLNKTKNAAIISVITKVPLSMKDI